MGEGIIRAMSTRSIGFPPSLACGKGRVRVGITRTFYEEKNHINVCMCFYFGRMAKRAGAVQAIGKSSPDGASEGTDVCAVLFRQSAGHIRPRTHRSGVYWGASAVGRDGALGRRSRIYGRRRIVVSCGVEGCAAADDYVYPNPTELQPGWPVGHDASAHSQRRSERDWLTGTLCGNHRHEKIG